MKPKTKEKPFKTSMRISRELHKKMKSAAALCGVSIQKWMTDLIEINLK
jgi:predicted HicB family RNase H-like nuclease